MSNNLYKSTAHYIPDEGNVWVPWDEASGSEIKLCKLNPSTGEMVVMIKTPPGKTLTKHFHPGTVALYTIQGHWTIQRRMDRRTWRRCLRARRLHPRSGDDGSDNADHRVRGGPRVVRVRRQRWQTRRLRQLADPAQALSRSLRQDRREAARRGFVVISEHQHRLHHRDIMRLTVPYRGVRALPQTRCAHL
jgi:hypothetical protein